MRQPVAFLSDAGQVVRKKLPEVFKGARPIDIDEVGLNSTDINDLVSIGERLQLASIIVFWNFGGDEYLVELAKLAQHHSRTGGMAKPVRTDVIGNAFDSSIPGKDGILYDSIPAKSLLRRRVFELTELSQFGEGVGEFQTDVIFPRFPGNAVELAGRLDIIHATVANEK